MANFVVLRFHFSEEECYPVEIKQVHPKLGQKPKLVTCFTFVASSSLPKHKNDQGRRHTISGFEIHDKSHRLNLRDDLLRNLAKKEAKSLHKIEEEKKALPIESYNRHQTRRRSTIVTDVLKEVTPPMEAKKDPKDRKPSLVTDVIKFDPKNVERRGSILGLTTNLQRPPQLHPKTQPKPQPQNRPQSEHQPKSHLESPKAPTANQREKSPGRHIPGGRDSRYKEISKLKHTSAAKAAKMAFKEAHISMQANRRLSLRGPDHYLTMQTVVRIQGMKDGTEKKPSANTKFTNWQKKFQVGLKQNT